jgi:hypothetical protein
LHGKQLLAWGALALLVLAALGTGAAANHSVTEQVSVGQINGNGAVSATFSGASADGTHVFFTTTEQLVSADTDSATDVYERSGGVTTRVSAGQINGNGAFGAGFSGSSADGTRIFFFTTEQLVSSDTDAFLDVYERSGGVTTRVSAGQINGNGALGAAFAGSSADGTRVFFITAEQLVSSDTDSVTDVYERSGAVTTRISAGQINGNGAVTAAFASASQDGTRVFFDSQEQLVSADTDSALDIYQRSGGVTTLVSDGQAVGTGAPATFTGASADGTRVFFFSAGQLTSSDTDSALDVYQRSGGTTTLISAGQINGNGAFDVNFRDASADGTRVFFITNEQLATSDTDSTTDVYERSSGTTTQISRGQINGNGAFAVTFAGASQDGTRVFFSTTEQLASTDTDAVSDVYERSGATTTQVSLGQANGNGANAATFRAASADGKRVYFISDERLADTDTEGQTDIFERAAGTTTQVSRGQINGNGAFTATFSGASQDGTRVFFTTLEPLASTDTDSSQDVYVAGAFPLAPYPTPRSANDIEFYLVPAFRQTISSTQCTARGGTVRTHGAPFGVSSCDPPALPAGTVAYFGREAIGTATLNSIDGNPLTAANEADRAIGVDLTDLRSGDVNGVDYNPNAGGPDVTLLVKHRISDLFNGASQTDPGTVADLDFSVAVNCATTADPEVGSTCSVATTANAVTPDAVREGGQAVTSTFRIRLNDAGANGVRGDSDDRNFAQQGVYTP